MQGVYEKYCGEYLDIIEEIREYWDKPDEYRKKEEIYEYWDRKRIEEKRDTRVLRQTGKV